MVHLTMQQQQQQQQQQEEEDADPRRHHSRNHTARTLRRRDDGLLVYTPDNGAEEVISPGEVVCILPLPRSQGYVVVRLEESPDDAEAPYRLHTHVADDADRELLDRHLARDVPEFLRHGHELHVVVSTKSGTGLALKFWEVIVRPLLTLVAGEDDDARKAVDDRHLLVTETAQSVRDFARSRWARKRADGSDSKTSTPETILLLSGDGGVVDLLNGADDDTTQTTTDPSSLPTIALLPLGTANALFHSLHKPLYTSDGPGPAPSPLALALRTLIRGRPAPLPSFRADFTPGSRLVSYSPTADGGDDASIHRHDTAVSHLYGAIVASYGFHAQLVWESDTPEYRRHGDKRFGMVAAELLRESHAYRADVSVFPEETASDVPWTPIRPPGTSSSTSPPSFNYVLATLVSNLERTFTISPASRPLGTDLRLVHFGDVGGARTMDIMKAAYDGGRHVGLPDVGYERVGGLAVRVLEEDARWRKVCVDGTIVEIPRGGEMRVRRVEGALFGVLVDEAVLGL